MPVTRKSTILLAPVLVVLLVALEGTQRFSIQNTAQYLAPFWFRHYAYLPYQRYWEFVEAVRKVGHMVGYGLACLVFFSATFWWFGRRAGASGGWDWRNRAAGWALILTMLLGCADELHQRYVPQRTSTITDVGFDVCGGYLALLVLFAIFRPRNTRPAPSKRT